MFDTNGKKRESISKETKDIKKKQMKNLKLQAVSAKTRLLAYLQWSPLNPSFWHNLRLARSHDSCGSRLLMSLHKPRLQLSTCESRLQVGHSARLTTEDQGYQNALVAGRHLQLQSQGWLPWTQAPGLQHQTSFQGPRLQANYHSPRLHVHSSVRPMTTAQASS